MSDDFGISEIPKFKKVSATIPQELFNEIQRRELFGDEWDRWLAEAIVAKLKEMEVKK